MTGLIVCIGIIVMMIILVLTIPLSYAITVHIGSPFHFNGMAHWFGHAFYYEWDYEDGNLPKETYYIGWENKSGSNSEPAPQAATSLDSIDEAPELITYDDVKDAAPETQAELSAADSTIWWWKPYVVNIDFMQSLISFVIRLLHHSRIRHFFMEGKLGLAAPHETGWLAAALYACVPGGIENLQFNFIEEEYDFHCYANGRLYPVVLLMHIISFASAKPARELLRCWLKKRKEQ